MLFKHQADGSVTANGSTLIGQNWTSPKFFHGRPDDFGPLRRSGTTRSSQTARAATRVPPTSVPGPGLLDNTKELIAYWHKMGVNPTNGPRHDLRQRARPRHHPGGRLRPGADGVQGDRTVPEGAGQPHRPRDQSAELGFLGSDYIDVLQLNEALAKHGGHKLAS